MIRLREALNRIADNSSVRLASMLSADGFLIECSEGANEKDQMVLAATCELIGLAGRMGKELDAGHCRSIVLRFDPSSVLIEAIEPDMIVATILADEENIDDIRSKIKNNAAQLRQCT